MQTMVFCYKNLIFIKKSSNQTFNNVSYAVLCWFFFSFKLIAAIFPSSAASIHSHTDYYIYRWYKYYHRKNYVIILELYIYVYVYVIILESFDSTAKYYYNYCFCLCLQLSQYTSHVCKFPHFFACRFVAFSILALHLAWKKEPIINKTFLLWKKSIITN